MKWKLSWMSHATIRLLRAFKETIVLVSDCGVGWGGVEGEVRDEVSGICEYEFGHVKV